MPFAGLCLGPPADALALLPGISAGGAAGGARSRGPPTRTLARECSGARESVLHAAVVGGPPVGLRFRVQVSVFQGLAPCTAARNSPFSRTVSHVE